MDAAQFFGLEPTDDPWRWRLPVVPGVCSGFGALFGGVGLGASIEAMERATGRSLVWATAQYLSFAWPPSVLDLEIDEVARGHQQSQARVVVRLDGEEILTVNAALGQRDAPWSGQWAEAPVVPSPDECPTRALLPRHQESMAGRLDMRLADARNPDEFPGPPGTGRSALWVRLPGLEVSAAALAVIGDYVPFGIGQALGQRAGGNSLDNTLRVVQRHRSVWILADIRVHAVQGGFGHGLVHLWSEDGILLGTASQSTIVRQWRDEGEMRRGRTEGNA